MFLYNGQLYALWSTVLDKALADNKEYSGWYVDIDQHYSYILTTPKHDVKVCFESREGMLTWLEISEVDPIQYDFGIPDNLHADISYDQLVRLVKVLLPGHKIEAIKLVRYFTKLDLRNAKHFVERLQE